MGLGGAVMWDFLLLVLLVASFIFGWFPIKKLDAFLDENREVPEEQLDISSNKDYNRK